jgi:hypothetical protein
LEVQHPCSALASKPIDVESYVLPGGEVEIVMKPHIRTAAERGCW